MNHQNHGEAEPLPQRIKHSRIKEMLDAFATGELPRGEMALVERHLASCRDCQQALQELQTFRTLLRTLALPISAEQPQAGPLGEEIISRLEQAEQEEIRMNERTFSATDPIQLVAPRKHRVWLRSLNTWAAVLCTIFLVGSLALTLQRVGQNIYGTPSSLETPPTELHPDIIWNTFHMVNAQTGWGEITRILQPASIPNQQEAIVRTTDSGQHWHDVSPPHNRWHAWISEAFVSATVAWGLASTDPEGQIQQGHISILRTIDGGRTWSVIHAPDLPSMDAIRISAIDAQHCWVYTGGALVLISTSDGGQHWRNLPQPDSPSATGPNIGSLTFLDAQTGWATGYSSTNNVPWFYTTWDGGQTWQLQHLNLPLQGEAFTVGVDGPVFFTSTDGILTISLISTSGAQTYTLFYQTHDRGLSWQNTGTNLASNARVQRNEVILSMKHWMVLDEQVSISNGPSSSTITLYETLDGGKSWRHTTPRLAYHNLGIAGFVTASTGWGLGNNMPFSYPSGFFRDTLLQTIDGGRTWQAAHYTLTW